MVTNTLTCIKTKLFSYLFQLISLSLFPFLLITSFSTGYIKHKNNLYLFHVLDCDVIGVRWELPRAVFGPKSLKCLSAEFHRVNHTKSKLSVPSFWAECACCGCVYVSASQCRGTRLKCMHDKFIIILPSYTLWLWSVRVKTYSPRIFSSTHVLLLLLFFQWQLRHACNTHIHKHVQAHRF